MHFNTLVIAALTTLAVIPTESAGYYSTLGYNRNLN